MPIVLDKPQVTRGGGAPDRRLPGSGRAVPTLVAATMFEINGLVMNQRQNLDYYHIESIDGLYDAEVRDSREINADRDGETFYGGMYAGKPLSIEGWIKAGSRSKLEDMAYALGEAWDDLSVETPLIGRTGDITRDWQVFVVKTQPVAMKDQQDSYEFKRPFMIACRSSKPRIYGVQLKQAAVDLNAGNSVVVENYGNRPAIPRILLFGAQTDVAIANSATNQTFRLKPGWTIPNGRYYEIDFEEGTIFDDLGVNRFDSFDHTSDWLTLKRESSQTLTVTSSGHTASSAITVYWYDTYK